MLNHEDYCKSWLELVFPWFQDSFCQGWNLKDNGCPLVWTPSAVKLEVSPTMQFTSWECTKTQQLGALTSHFPTAKEHGHMPSCFDSRFYGPKHFDRIQTFNRMPSNYAFGYRKCFIWKLLIPFLACWRKWHFLMTALVSTLWSHMLRAILFCTFSTLCVPLCSQKCLRSWTMEYFCPKKKKKNRKKRCNQIYKVKSPSILEEVKRKKIPSDTEINIIALLWWIHVDSQAIDIPWNIHYLSVK